MVLRWTGLTKTLTPVIALTFTLPGRVICADQSPKTRTRAADQQVAMRPPPGQTAITSADRAGDRTLDVAITGVTVDGATRNFTYRIGAFAAAAPDPVTVTNTRTTNNVTVSWIAAAERGVPVAGYRVVGTTQPYSSTAPIFDITVGADKRSATAAVPASVDPLWVAAVPISRAGSPDQAFSYVARPPTTPTAGGGGGGQAPLSPTPPPPPPIGGNILDPPEPLQLAAAVTRRTARDIRLIVVCSAACDITASGSVRAGRRRVRLKTAYSILDEAGVVTLRFRARASDLRRYAAMASCASGCASRHRARSATPTRRSRRHSANSGVLALLKTWSQAHGTLTPLWGPRRPPCPQRDLTTPDTSAVHGP